jgi:plastocyanin
MEAANRFGIRRWVAAFACAVAALLVISPAARAGVVTDGTPGTAGCPNIANKPDEVAHVDYPGMEHITYCYGPITIQPGQNVIKLREAIDGAGQKLWPQEDGYVTRFDPEFIYADGRVPPVDVLHLHHAVWLVDNGAQSDPQFAVGEEKTIQQLPEGFGWPSKPTDTWYLNDMLHDLVAQPAQVYVVWRLDFVPQAAAEDAGILPVHTKWLDVAGNPSLYPVFDALRSYGHNGTYTFPDQAPAADRQPCDFTGRAPDSHGCVGAAQSWTVPAGGATLISTAGHLHPGGLDTQLRDTRNGNPNTLFTSDAHYYEPAGEVSWDVSMGATPGEPVDPGDPPLWRVKVQGGDKVSVHATYDTRRADWYEVMGIMPVAVYNGTDVGGKDAQASDIPQNEVLTHTHLAENDNHGGNPTNAPNPLALPSAAAPDGTVNILSFAYQGVPGAGPSVPTVEPGQSLTFHNLDSVPTTNAFHTITACKDPCTASTGVAYPIANGPVTFDSGELGYNGNQGSIGNAPAANRDTWQTPKDLPAGTYTYFCRIHPFMRGAFRVEAQNSPRQTLRARKKQKLGKAAVTEIVSKAATVQLRAKVKGASASSGRTLSQALDAKRSTKSLNPGVKTKIKLRFSKKARKMVRAALASSGPMKVVVTANATDKWGKTSTAKAGFRLIG